MIRQVVLTEEEYEEIEKKLSCYAIMEERLKELQNIKKEYEDFRKDVADLFLDDNGQFRVYETSRSVPNRFTLDYGMVLYLVEELFGDRFMKETGLDLEFGYWKIRAL